MPETLDFKPHKSGDTFSGRQISIQVGSYSANFTNATIKADFRQDSPEGEVALSLSVGSGITIINANTGTFQFDAQIIDLTAGLYFYDVEITFQDGRVKTYIEGTWLILASITN
jgi:hypothetical protein